MPIKQPDTTIRIKTILEPGEREYYADVLTRQHYLGSAAMNRNTVMHVAIRGREEIAILTWESGTRQWFGMRDRLIGWTQSQREQRLKYCAENRRFLMLVKENNLASKVLRLSCERLNEGHKGHEFLLAETFVDPARGYDGGCYKAAGWHCAGLTQGGRGAQKRSKKLYFIKELKRDALSKLKAPELTVSDTTNPRQAVLFFERFDFESLRKKLDMVPDYRKIKGQYPLTSMLALIAAAVLCGETDSLGIQRWIGSLSQEFLRKAGFRRAPSHSTVWRVISNVSHEALCAKLCEWLAEHARRIHIAPELKVLSLDGKALRSAAKTAGSEMQLLTLIDSIAGIIRSQVMVGQKTNEIPHAISLLEATELDAQTLVTADALHTQRKTARAILKKTHTTSLPSKKTSQTSEKPSSKTPQKRIGHRRSVLRSLPTDA
jgi:hypothetical protein